jgi:nanoRNase/pAp phosphatase (c-di-AMP/oligoRNAs hydrolase)
MTISNIERVRLFYRRFEKTDKVLVMINADPDAIASAMAIRRLLWRKVVGVVLTHVNVIERPDNLAMAKLLGAKLIHVDAINPAQYNRLVLVDSQPDHHERFPAVDPDVIIDHHPPGPEKYKGLTDIRPDYGAASTIMTEYLKAAKIKPSAKLATALYLGIKTDTSNFERRAIMADVQAFQFIYRYTNTFVARRIEQAEIKPEFLKYFSRALDRHHLKRHKRIVHLGRVETPDICVIVADFFMRVSDIKWSIVSGIYGKTLIVILRNDGISKDAGKTAQNIFGAMGTAGGHKSMARAEVPLTVFYKTTEARTDGDIQPWLIQALG